MVKRLQPPCRQFATSGTCTFPNCRYSHDVPSTSGAGSSGSVPASRPKYPCTYFQRHGNCRFGAECKFSHDLSAPAPVEDSAVSLYRGWNQLLGGARRQTGPRGGGGFSRGPTAPELTADQMEKFLEDAIRILEIGSVETVQQLIRDLGSDRGLLRVMQIVSAEFTFGYSTQNLSFKRHCIPFLQILAHEEMRASLVLEKEVGTLFNFIYGVGGRRGIEFFTQVMQHLVTASEQNSKDLLEGGLYATSLALFNTLNLNQGAAVQEEFKTIVRQLDTLANSAGPDVSRASIHLYRLAQQEISRIKILLHVADALPNSSRYKPAEIVARSIDRHLVDFPGELSAEGPRHDNDHADISKIRILPTTEEINSHRNEFLPQRSIDYPHHLEGISRVLDFQFRLLREDTSGQIREAVRAVLDNWDELTGEKDKKDARKLKSKAHGVRTILYQNARVENMRCSNRDGIILSVSFDQPFKVQALKETARKEWWERSKYLAVGSLLCLVDSMKRATFLVVCDRKVLAKEYKRPSLIDEPTSGPNTDLASDQYRAWITLRFAQTVTESDIESVFQLSSTTLQVLVEFPGLLFASFDPVLKSLQQISKAGNLPFPHWLAPSEGHQYIVDPRFNQYVEVPPPLYMTKSEMNLNLSSITKGAAMTFAVGSGLETADLENATTLDHGQSEALLASLSRELALIQGPPGTGKSYLGVQIVKVLLDNRDKTDIGPIICVCYTNHALDQFLEHLLDDGIKNIVRIGSRSKSPRVAALALHEVTQHMERTPLEKYQLAKARDELSEIERNIEAACKQLLQPSDAATLKGFLETAYPVAYESIFGEAEDDEGFTVVKRKKGGRRGVEQVLQDWVDCRYSPPQNGHRGASRNRPLEELRNESVLGMSRIERQKLLEYWYEEMKENASENLLKAAETHEQERNNITRQQQEQERRCLSKSFVIGLTTTGLASHANLIRSLKAKVLVCEEAAEVLEAHILTAFLPTTEHAILIGDHLQLRPQIMKHDFSIENPRGGKAYGLNTSLFERAVEVERYGGKKFPVAKLDTQRRMHPSIADLVRNTLYPGLTDHPSTTKRPEVPGMARRLFWMDHRHPEASEDKLELIQTSHANEFEADMAVALVRHLSRQGVYKSGEIAVLSPYLRQLFILRSKLAAMFEVVIGDRDQEQLDEALESGELEEESPAVIPGVADKVVKKGALLSEVRVATVDNFQGEEAKVIIISLVRSNKANKCGFLKTSNRINVLLSRAMDGMYIIGNAETCGQVPMWSKIISMLENGNNIDRTLEIRCERHPENLTFISQPDDFHLLSPEGGCNERCEWRLDCGHPCVRKCHSQLLHKNTMCLEPCNKSYKNCSHTCPKVCGEACGNCVVKVAGVPLPCGHIPKSLKCYQLQDLALVKCTKLIEREIEACGHVVTMPCQADPKTYRCNKRCGGILPCGHECSSLCSSCTQRTTAAADTGEGNRAVTIHAPCRVICGRKYSTCQHNCIKTCHGTEGACPPCTQPCAIRCDHSVCGKKCSEPCAPCAERCSWTCKHRQRCDMPCAVPCNINPCSERCDKQLDCGHQCPSVCGETCPDVMFCQVCADEATLNRGVDLITFETYEDIDLDTDPIVVPRCGHFYTVSTYDSIMRMKNAYYTTPEGKILGPRPLDGSDEPDSDGDPPEKLMVKNCPDCRAPLRDIHRYNRIVKVACLDESTKRFCTYAQANFLKIYKEVSDAQDLLSANRNDFLIRTRQRATKRHNFNADRLPFPIEERIGRMHGMLKKISNFIVTVREEEQPYVRVRDLVLSKQRRRPSNPSSNPSSSLGSSFPLDSSVVQMGFRLKSVLLFIGFRWESLWDIHTIAESELTEPVTKTKLVRLVMREIPWIYRQCADIVRECQEASLAKYEVEARIYKAQFWSLWKLENKKLNPSATTGGQHATVPQTADVEQLQSNRNPFTADEKTTQKEEVLSLDRCSELCTSLPGTIGPLESKINAAKKMLGGYTFYEAVSREEKEQVYLALQGEFSSTGRWHTCMNGHPFTIGNCGAPNQTAMCPECGAPIGGGARGFAEGVRDDQEFAEMDRRLGHLVVRHW